MVDAAGPKARAPRQLAAIAPSLSFRWLRLSRSVRWRRRVHTAIHDRRAFKIGRDAEEILAPPIKLGECLLLRRNGVVAENSAFLVVDVQASENSSALQRKKYDDEITTCRSEGSHGMDESKAPPLNSVFFSLVGSNRQHKVFAQ